MGMATRAVVRQHYSPVLGFIDYLEVIYEKPKKIHIVPHGDGVIFCMVCRCGFRIVKGQLCPMCEKLGLK